MDSTSDDTHTTLGRHFRTPAHPEVLQALGRATYNFLSLEETVSAVLAESGLCTLPVARGLTAGAKEKALVAIEAHYRSTPSGAAVAAQIEQARCKFGELREEVRNKLFHAHPFAAGKDSEGRYLPGLAYTSRDGSAWHTLATTPEEIMDLASRIEQAIGPVSALRTILNLSAVQPT